MEDKKIKIAKAAGIYAELHGITQLQALDVFEEVVTLLAAQYTLHLTGGTCQHLYTVENIDGTCPICGLRKPASG